jgi:hypothetical protein
VGCSLSTSLFGLRHLARPEPPGLAHQALRRAPRRCQGAPLGAPSAASLPSDSVAGAWHSAALSAQQSLITRTRDDPILKWGNAEETARTPAADDVDQAKGTRLNQADRSCSYTSRPHALGDKRSSRFVPTGVQPRTSLKFILSAMYPVCTQVLV